MVLVVVRLFFLLFKRVLTLVYGAVVFVAVGYVSVLGRVYSQKNQ